MRHLFARQQQGFREMPAHRLDVMQHGQHGAPLTMPALHDRQQVGGSLGVQRGEGFVQKDQLGVL